MPLRADTLSFHYPRNPPILHQVCFEPRAGRVTAIVGPNGSGKSTLLRLLLGSLIPTDGSVRFAGPKDSLLIHRLGPRQRARSIAYIAQRPDAAFAYPLRRVVELGRLALGRPAHEDRAAADNAIHRLGLAELADRPLTTLSVGQQQRAAIARAVAQLDRSAQPSAGDHPRILLADEPIAALDPSHAASTLQLFRSLADDGIAVVVVLHDLLAASRSADDALLLANGRVVAQGTASQVLTPDTLSPVFGIGFTMPIEGVLIPAGQ